MVEEHSQSARDWPVIVVTVDSKTSTSESRYRYNRLLFFSILTFHCHIADILDEVVD